MLHWLQYRALEADSLTLVHFGLIASHRDPDHLPALGVHRQDLHHPLGQLAGPVHLLLPAAELGLRLRGLRDREGVLLVLQQQLHDHHFLSAGSPFLGLFAWVTGIGHESNLTATRGTPVQPEGPTRTSYCGPS